MKTIDAIQARRAVKAFDPNHKMSAHEETELFRLALLSPTAFNIQNWRFVCIYNDNLRTEIRKVAWDQAQITDSSLLIVICADLKAWDKNPQRYWKNASSDMQDFIVTAIGDYYQGKEQVQRDEAFRSSGIAAQTLMLAAQALGYASCPMIGFDFDAVGKLIELPHDHVVTLCVAIGKPVQDAHPRGGQLDLSEIVLHNTF